MVTKKTDTTQNPVPVNYNTLYMYTHIILTNHNKKHTLKPSD